MCKTLNFSFSKSPTGPNMYHTACANEHASIYASIDLKRHMCVCSCHYITFLSRRKIKGCRFAVADCTLCLCLHVGIFYSHSSLCQATKVLHSIPACTKMAELASLQVYPLLHPWLLWLLTMVTICDMAADFGRWIVHLSWDMPGSAAQRAGFVTDSPSLCSCLYKPRARAASAGTGATQLRHRSCQSKLQGSRTKGGSHVACNFLEAIKPTLFNSLSNTHAILSVKWSFNAQLPVESWKKGMWKALCKTMLNISANFSG